MYVKLHQNARTTPAIRREIQASSLSGSELAARHGIGKATALKWKKRDSVEDLPYTPHNFSKTMSDFEEFVVIELRKSLLLPLDDLLDLPPLTRPLTLGKSRLLFCEILPGSDLLNRCAV